MNTFEAIMRERGFTIEEESDRAQRAGSFGCLLLPEEPNTPFGDCGQLARWHFRLRSEVFTDGQTLAACDHHAGIVHVVYAAALLGYHEWGDACNLSIFVWIEPEASGSFCATPERAVELGYAVHP